LLASARTRMLISAQDASFVTAVRRLPARHKGGASALAGGWCSAAELPAPPHRSGKRGEGYRVQGALWNSAHRYDIMGMLPNHSVCQGRKADKMAITVALYGVGR